MLDTTDNASHPMSSICKQWMEKIKDAKKVKKEKSESRSRSQDKKKSATV